MSVTDSNIIIMKDFETITQTILTNTIKMLLERNWLNPSLWTIEHIISYVKNKQENQLYIIKGIDKNIYIKIIQQKISSLSSAPILTDFIKEYENKYKIIIVDDIVDKIIDTYYTLENIEIFKKSFLMINIIDYVCSPKYQILTEDEKDKFINEYDIKKKELKKMFESDPISKYYKLKKGDIVRIIRSSQQTGLSIDYRIVISK